jgi:hypothetical protein
MAGEAGIAENGFAEKEQHLRVVSPTLQNQMEKRIQAKNLIHAVANQVIR